MEGIFWYITIVKKKAGYLVYGSNADIEAEA
jgi:hypothetical protein